MNTMMRSWGGFLLLIVCAAGAPFLLERIGQHGVPSALAGLQLVRVYDGAEAEAVVNRMHGSVVATAKTTIGMYAGSEGRAALYVSTYPTDAGARADFDRMCRRIAPGDSGFTNFQKMTVDGKEVAVCVGLGQIHCFFYHRNRLSWLASDSNVAREVLKDLLARSAR
jgi:hypothetical protein